MNTMHLPGVIKAVLVPLRNIPPRIELRDKAGLDTYIRGGENMQLARTGSITIIEEQPGQKKAKATLRIERLAVSSKGCAIAFLTADGEWLLMGSREGPAPAITAQWQSGDPGSESWALTLTAALEGPRPLTSVVVF